MNIRSFINPIEEESAGIVSTEVAIMLAALVALSLLVFSQPVVWTLINLDEASEYQARISTEASYFKLSDLNENGITDPTVALNQVDWEVRVRQLHADLIMNGMSEEKATGFCFSLMYVYRRGFCDKNVDTAVYGVQSVILDPGSTCPNELPTKCEEMGMRALSRTVDSCSVQFVCMHDLSAREVHLIPAVYGPVAPSFSDLVDP